MGSTEGFYQMQLQKEHHPWTCVSSSRGTMQSTVQVMGLENAGAQYQRMREWVLKNLPCAEHYLGDIALVSTRNSVEEINSNHTRNVRLVLQTLADNKMVCNAARSSLSIEK